MEEMISGLKKQVDALLEAGSRILIAIDGCCTAGKTTLAAALAEEYDCNVFHMDDFFLRPEQRTAQRYAQPGGNVDYERFREEVLIPLGKGEAFSYRPFSCGTLTLTEPVTVTPKALNIVEGTYSHHPYFGDPYDLRIFLGVDGQTQRERILQRPSFLAERFFSEWIPMESHYFRALGIPERADIRLDTGRGSRI